MDGWVLEDAIDGDYRRENPVKRTPASPSIRPDRLDFDSSEAKAMEERLRGLGYID
jgi:hypothetical protein